MNPHRLKSYLMLLSVAAIWGAASPIIKFTLQGLDPLPFLSYRFLIAGIFSIIFFKVKGFRFPKTKNALPLTLLYGFLTVPLALGLLFTGLDQSSVLDLTLIGAVGPMMVTAGAAFIFRDRITHHEKIGIAIVLLGVFINSFYPLFGDGADARLTGNLYLLAFLLADSSGILVAKRAVQEKIKSSTLTNFAFILGAIIIIPITAFAYGPGNLFIQIQSLSLKYHLGVWYMALISGSLAYFLYVRGQRTIEASEAVLFNYLQPVFTIPLAIFWLGEKLSVSFVVGAAIITFGLIIAEHKKRKSTQENYLL